MRTLEYLPEEKQRRIAQETREIYAPLAHRFGMARIRWELEDLAFKFLEPEAYQDLAKRIVKKRRERERLIQTIADPLSEALTAAGISADIAGRPKHLYSIYRKMLTLERPLEEIYDLLAIRVLTRPCRLIPRACIIPTLWTPLNERSGHMRPPNRTCTVDAHHRLRAEGTLSRSDPHLGHAPHRRDRESLAHWKYKEGTSNGGSELDEKLTWFREILDWQKDMTDPREFLEYLKIDLFKDEIFVFTPKGELIQLPAGATPIDFAFMVHTQVGLRCSGDG